MIEKAKMASKEAHESISQKRKYVDKPYYTHPHAVAELVSQVTDDEHVIAAAYLHDVIEDVSPYNSKYNEDWIEKEFGTKVLNLVIELTNKYTKKDYPNLNRSSRKYLESMRISNISEDAKIIKKADLYHNSTEMDHTLKFSKVWLNEKIEIEKLIGEWKVD